MKSLFLSLARMLLASFQLSLVSKCGSCNEKYLPGMFDKVSMKHISLCLPHNSPTRATNYLPKAHDQATENFFFFLSCWAKQFKLFPKQFELLLPLSSNMVASQRLKVNPYCWKHCAHKTQDWDRLSWIYPKISLPAVQCPLYQKARKHNVNSRGR